jgi:hypothetical protein
VAIFANAVLLTTVIANNAGTFNATAPLAPGGYSITAVSQSCTSAPVSVTITPCGTVTAQLAPAAQTVALGSNIVFTVSATGGTAPYTFQLTRPNSSVITTTGNTITIPNATVVDFGTYSLVAIDATSSTSAPVLAVVTQAAAGDLRALIDPIALAIPLGNSIIFTAIPIGGISPYDYAWFGPQDGGAFGRSATSSEARSPNPNITFLANTRTLVIPNATLKNTGLYSVIVTDSVGDNNTPVAPAVVAPSFSAGIIPAGADVTIGDTIQLTAMPIGGVGPHFTYLWAGPNGFSATTKTIQIPNAQPIDSGFYSVIITDTTTGDSAPASVQVTVSSTPIILAVQPPTQTVSLGGTINLAALASGGLAPYSFTWINPQGTVIANTQTVTLNGASQSNSGIYTVIVEDANGSIKLATGLVAVNPTINVTIDPLALSIVPSGTSTIQFTAHAQGGVAPFAYQWVGPNGFTASTQSITITHATALNAGQYIVLALDAAGNISNPAIGTVTIGSVGILLTAPADNTITSNEQPIIAGITAPNRLVSIFANNIFLGTTTSDASGNYNFRPTAPLAPGTYVLLASINENGTISFSNIVTITILGRQSLLSIAIRAKYCSNNLLT